MTEQHTLKYMLIWAAIMIPLIVIAAAVSPGWFKYGLVKYRGQWMRGDFAEKLKKDSVVGILAPLEAHTLDVVQEK
jgi:hypothetical protein